VARRITRGAPFSTHKSNQQHVQSDAIQCRARIWYQETGEGDPVVQIHGPGFGHFNFSTATPILSKTFRCIDFDMR
jgi:pimeloyl-ACP methyl ester carboxylesterase